MNGDNVKLPDGLTLRDYFAAAALNGIMANAAIDWPKQSNHFKMATESAFALADAMLAAREKK